MSKARDQAAIALSSNIAALKALGGNPPVTLEILYRHKLLPLRIYYSIYNCKKLHLELHPVHYKDLGGLDEADFYSFGKLRGCGLHVTEVFRSLSNIYVETKGFQKLPAAANLLPDADIGVEEQDALIERIVDRVRSDRNARGSLYRMFPPTLPRP